MLEYLRKIETFILNTIIKYNKSDDNYLKQKNDEMLKVLNAISNRMNGLKSISDGIDQLKQLTEKLLDRDIELKRSKEEWVNTFNSVPDIILVLDKKLNIRKLNNSYFNIKGGSEDEYIGKKYYEILYNEYRELDLQQYIESQKEYIPHLGGWYIISFDKLYCENTFTGYVVVARNITELQEKEEKIIKANNFLHMVLDDQIESICRFTPDYTITFANKKFYEMHNLDKDGIIGMNLLDIHSYDKKYVETIKNIIENLNKLNRVDRRVVKALDLSGNGTYHDKIHTAIFNGKPEPIEYQCVSRELLNYKEELNHE